MSNNIFFSSLLISIFLKFFFMFYRNCQLISMKQTCLQQSFHTTCTPPTFLNHTLLFSPGFKSAGRGVLIEISCISFSVRLIPISLAIAGK
ncbi:MAG: hypothetical protein Ct9H90mP2_10790 [Dehalococcoidia bacterium]|nr:MAG: hypothetical protein Ct9H90mP2_10790 [Dehalococcoidia bacterium]